MSCSSLGVGASVQLTTEEYSVLEDQPDMTLIAQASSGREAIETFRQHRPDVTLMDLRMPDII